MGGRGGGIQASHQQDGVEHVVAERRLVDAAVAADVLAGAVHHAGDGQLGHGHGRRLRQLGESRAEVSVLCKRQDDKRTGG